MSARKLITEHLDLWTGAVNKKSSSGRGSNSKIKLTGIKKLRGLILELAVRGLLTEQDSNEKDASEIVENLLKEQQRLVSDGLIKKPKSLKPLDESEKPHSLPKDWQWIRLGQTMEMYNGRAFKSSEWSTSGLPIVRIQNLNDPTAPTNHFAGQIDDRNVIGSGTFLISWSGTPGTSFGAFIWTRGSAALNQHINKCVFFGDYVNPRFMQLAVNGQMKNFIQSAQGGVGLKHVTKGVLTNALIALPPEEEQHRIVQKVDELMALCDRLEQQTSDQLEAHETLVDTLLGTLTQSENATELADNWARLAAHFDTLFTTEQSIDKLKQSILQLAVLGRLVEQDAGDESASKLLDNIEKKKQSLYEAGVIKKPKSLSPISEDERHTLLPPGWTWARFGHTGYTRLGKMLDKAKNTGKEKPYLRNTNVQWWAIDIEDVKTFKLEDHELDEYRLKDGDLLICEGGEPGRCAVWRHAEHEMYFQKAIHRHRLLGLCSPDYLKICLTVDCNNGRLSNRFTGATIKHLPGDKLMAHVCAVAPLPEQHRIVQKVDELMALCDHLKERLNQAGETRCQLAETVVENALH